MQKNSIPVTSNYPEFPNNFAILQFMTTTLQDLRDGCKGHLASLRSIQITSPRFSRLPNRQNPTEDKDVQDFSSQLKHLFAEVNVAFSVAAWETLAVHGQWECSSIAY